MTSMPPIQLAHSPDPDDAFMWWPLVGRIDMATGDLIPGSPPVDTDGFQFETVAADIAELNRRAPGAPYEITAMSCGTYPFVAEKYAITACGASMGDGYGPKIVASSNVTCEDLTDDGRPTRAKLAAPGARTSALMATRLRMNCDAVDIVIMPFRDIIPAILAGDVDAGIIIHEAQLTYGDEGLHLVEDLGAWWKRTRGSLLPLGLNVIRRDVAESHGPDALARITRVLQRSLAHAIEHRDESIRYALGFAGGMAADQAGEFIDLYVNRWTMAFGPDGENAVCDFLTELSNAGHVPPLKGVDFVAPTACRE